MRCRTAHGEGKPPDHGKKCELKCECCPVRHEPNKVSFKHCYKAVAPTQDLRIMPSPNLGSSVAVASAAVASVASAAVASPKARAMARARVRARAWIYEPKAAPPPEPTAAPPPEPKAAPPPEPKAPPPLFEPKAAPPAEYSKFLADKDVDDSKFLAC